MKNKDLIVGKILDFFMILEIRRSNSFKAVGRALRNFIVNFGRRKK